MATTPTLRRHALPFAAALSLIGVVTPVAAQQRSNGLRPAVQSVSLSAPAATGATDSAAPQSERTAASTSDASRTAASSMDRRASWTGTARVAAPAAAVAELNATIVAASPRGTNASANANANPAGRADARPAAPPRPTAPRGAAPTPRTGETCNGLPATHVGTNGPDTIIGTNGDDVIVALDGDDNIIPGRGNDTVCAGAGNDQVSDSDGDDVHFGGPGNDQLIGGRDNDELYGEDGNDNLDGGSGNDLLDGGADDDTLLGGRNDDTLLGGTGTNTLNGGQNFDLCDIGEAGTALACENFRPTAADVSIAAQEDGPVVTGAFAGADPDGDPLTYAILGQPSEGSAANNGDGTFDFDPGTDFQDLAAGETRDVTFDYTASDAFQTSAPATVTVTVTGVNDDPVAADDADDTDEDTAIDVDVLGNDTDVDASDVLSVSAVDTTGTTGAVTNNGDDVTYDPSGAFDALTASQSDTDTFGYTVSDGNGGTDTATVTITVNGVNDIPIAQPVAVAATEDGDPVDGSFDADDADSDDDPSTLTYAIVAQPTEGSVVDNGDGTFTFDPGADFQDLAAGATRDVTFDYTATDSNAATSAPATVTVTVTGVDDPPFAGDDDAGTTDEDTPITTPNVLGNDGDPDAGETVSVTGAAAGSSAGGAAVTNNFDGTFEYDPSLAFDFLAAGESTVDTFPYTVSSSGGGTANADVSIEVTGVNDAPTADDGAAFGSGTFTITLTGTDPDDSDDLEFSVDTTGTVGEFENLTNSDGTCSPQPCTAIPKNSATIDYTAPLGEPEETFTFTVDDGNGGMDTATVVINLDPGTEPPAAPPGVSGVDAKDQAVETLEDTAVAITLNAASDAAGDLTFTIVTPPNASAGSVAPPVDDDPDGAGPLPVRSATTTFTPVAGFTGSASFVFEACEVANPANCDQATVSIDVATVAPPVAPTAPDIRDLSLSVEEDDSLDIELDDALLTAGVPGCPEPPCQRSGPTGEGGPAARALTTGAQADLFDEITDPAGDATATGSLPVSPDLVGAQVGITASIDNVAFNVDYATGTFDAVTTRTGIVIDIDSNPATGFAGVDAANNDSTLMGVEYLVNIGANLGANAEIRKWVSGNTFTTVAVVPATINATGHYVNFDLNLLGGDEGHFSYKVTTQGQISPTPGFTGILDYMTDLGSPPGVLAATGNAVDAQVRYTITSLPQTGTLFDAEGDPVTTVPFTSFGSKITFVPDTGTSGTSVSFQFIATNTALQSTIGQVLIALQAPTCEEAEAACDDGRP